MAKKPKQLQFVGTDGYGVITIHNCDDNFNCKWCDNNPNKKEDD